MHQPRSGGIHQPSAQALGRLKWVDHESRRDDTTLCHRARVVSLEPSAEILEERSEGTRSRNSLFLKDLTSKSFKLKDLAEATP